MSRTLLVLFACLLLQPACRDKSEDDFLTESDIRGTWLVPNFDNSFHLTGSFAGDEVDERGESTVSDSDLQLTFLENGRWTSSGSYTVTVSSQESQHASDLTGIGSGMWSFSQDTLYVTGLRTYNETGFFAEDQALVVKAFEKEKSLDLESYMDALESNEEFNINLRTRANYDILMVR